jgi:hypothetical protein
MTGKAYWVPALVTLGLALAGAAYHTERALTIVEERKPDRDEVGRMINQHTEALAERLNGIAQRLEDVVQRLERSNTREH